MVFAPDTTMMAFSMMVYYSPDHIAGFGFEAMKYIALAHAVFGSVLVGWGVSLLCIVIGPFKHGDKVAWQAIVISLLAWFIPDTTFSLLSGFWQNAVLNFGFAALYFLPLYSTRSVLKK